MLNETWIHSHVAQTTQIQMCKTVEVRNAEAVTEGACLKQLNE